MSPCVGGSELASNGRVCLSGSQSPFGDIQDVLIQCSINGKGTVWSVCTGSRVAECSGCLCNCYENQQLSEYANGMGTFVNGSSVCFDNEFLPNAINPIDISISCTNCNGPMESAPLPNNGEIPLPDFAIRLYSPPSCSSDFLGTTDYAAAHAQQFACLRLQVNEGGSFVSRNVRLQCMKQQCPELPGYQKGNLQGPCEGTNGLEGVMISARYDAGGGVGNVTLGSFSNFPAVIPSSSGGVFGTLQHPPVRLTVTENQMIFGVTSDSQFDQDPQNGPVIMTSSSLVSFAGASINATSDARYRDGCNVALVSNSMVAINCGNVQGTATTMENLIVDLVVQPQSNGGQACGANCSPQNQYLGQSTVWAFICDVGGPLDTECDVPANATNFCRRGDASDIILETIVDSIIDDMVANVAQTQMNAGNMNQFGFYYPGGCSSNTNLQSSNINWITDANAMPPSSPFNPAALRAYCYDFTN